MRSFYWFCLIPIFSWYMVSCGKPQADSQSITKATEKMSASLVDSQRLLEEGYQCTPSPEHGQYTLCVKSKSVAPTLPQVMTHYCVYRTSDNQLIRQDSLFNGTIKWHSSHQLSIFLAPGVASRESTPESHTTIIDIEK